MYRKRIYPVLSDKAYDAKFGINPENKKKRTAALERAWKNRDFEIDKFWTRSAYFWGFIALIFGGYIGLTTGKDISKIKEMYLDLYLILLGIIFSVAWLLVIKGSKRWQENWEAHIDKLEDDVTGPLYKTVFCTGDSFFSVSKINTILAYAVIVVWVLFFCLYIFRNIKLFKNILCWILSILLLEQNLSKAIEFIFILLAVILTVVCIGVLIKFGQSAGSKYSVKPKNKKGVFVDRAGLW